jgi:3-phenylpropionate/trans-cinnamate dioxygenase ferredoxin reductase subunit
MVILGAGHCGARAAQSLRKHGWAGAIHLVGNENHLPYERPPLSKGILTGDPTIGQSTILSPYDIASLDIKRHVAQGLKVEPSERHLTLSTGEILKYTALLISTGGQARRFDIAGSQLPQVLTLRTVDDAQRLAKRLCVGHRLVVVGGGFIGLEVAASAIARGCTVTVIEMSQHLMGRAVPNAIAARAQALHAQRGVTFVLQNGIASITEDRACSHVHLTDGSHIDADTVLLGIGIDVDTKLARAAGLAVGRGILVNALLMTSVAGIFAAGDVAEFPSGITGLLIRQETWHNAETQAATVAANMLGQNLPYNAGAWFWSDQYEYQLQVSGEPAAGVTAISRSTGNEDLIIFYLDSNSRLVGSCGWGPSSAIAKDLKIARALVERATLLRAKDLQDPAINLKTLLNR